MRIRSARPSDARLIIKFDHVARAEPSRVALIKKAISARSCFVATLGARVVAYGLLEHSFFGNGFISIVYVSSEFRRQGIGSALMRHIEHACATSKLFTSTNRSNVPMRRLLKKLGYVPSGVVNNLDVGDPEFFYYKPIRRKARRRSASR